ncbi:MAG: AMP-binding protein [Anaerolineae bacterium]|nr:AMP-binding protein [Anaerolineae bacterium]
MSSNAQTWLPSAARANPHTPALIIGDQTWTYAELHALAHQCAAHLHTRGLRSGDRVAVLLANSWEYVALIHATALLGAIIVPLNTRLTVSEIAWQLNHVRAALLIYSTDTAALAAACEIENHVIVSDLFDNPAEGRSETYPYQPTSRRGEAKTRPLSDSSAPIPPRQMERGPGVRLDLDSPAAIVFTSGTSGQPKGVVLTYANFLYSALGSANRLGTLPGDRWLCCLPLYHVGGLSIIQRCCLYGTTVILQNGFDMAQIQHAFNSQAVTLISLVPTMLYRLIASSVGSTDSPPRQMEGGEVNPIPLSTEWGGARGGDGLQFPSTLRLILLGGAAASPDLLAKSHALGLPVATTYGLTEACSQVATLFPAETKPGSVGRPLMFSGVEILREDGTSAEIGEYGEVVVSGKMVMAGYYENPHATDKVLREGRLYTGDIGYLDTDGDLWIVQRRSDLIVSGGENVYPVEIENTLRQHPAVADCCAVGLPDAEWGQLVAMAVVLKSGFNADPAALTAFCRQHLAGYKIPRRWAFVERLPQNATGKIQRRAVTELFD